MIVHIFAVFDSKAKNFGQPFFSLSREVAQRAFMSAVHEPESMLCKHPTDFSLFELGTFNDSNGIFTTLATPENLGLAASYKQVPQAPQQLTEKA